MKQNKNLYILFAFSFLLLLPIESYAQTSAKLDTMFANFSASAEAITKLIQYSSWIIGLYLVIGSVYKFAQLGSNPQLSPKVPISMFFVGVAIFSLTGMISVFTSTMAMGNTGPGAILAPTAGGFGATTAAGLSGVLLFIRMVGYLAFVRGWLLINAFGQGKEGTLGRGLTHVFGGVAAINVQVTADIIANTLAPGMKMPW